MCDVKDLKGIERMSPGGQELVREFQRLGVGVISDREKGQLWFQPPEKITPALLRRAREHAAELMDLITFNESPAASGA